MKETHKILSIEVTQPTTDWHNCNQSFYQTTKKASAEYNFGIHFMIYST